MQPLPFEFWHFGLLGSVWVGSPMAPATPCGSAVFYWSVWSRREVLRAGNDGWECQIQFLHMPFCNSTVLSHLCRHTRLPTSTYFDHRTTTPPSHALSPPMSTLTPLAWHIREAWWPLHQAGLSTHHPHVPRRQGHGPDTDQELAPWNDFQWDGPPLQHDLNREVSSDLNVRTSGPGVPNSDSLVRVLQALVVMAGVTSHSHAETWNALAPSLEDHGPWPQGVRFCPP